MEVEIKKQYSYENILEMLGGHKYFSHEQALYCYHKLNDNKEEADHYLKICLAESQKVNQYHDRFKTQEEIDAINKEKESYDDYVERKYKHIIES